MISHRVKRIKPGTKGRAVHLIVALLVVSLFFVMGSVAHAASGIWGTFVVINANGGGNVYYEANDPCNNCPLYQGHNFGEVENLVLNGGEVKTWKNSGSNVTGAAMFYRIYMQGSPNGAFTSVSLPFHADLGNGDQSWQTSSAGIDLLVNLDPGTYVLEIYFEAYSTDGIHYDSRSGQNYQAFFTVPIPTAVTLAAFTATAQSDHVLVVWETVSELETLGFNLYRSTDPATTGERLNGTLIPAHAGGGSQGASYEWADEGVVEGTTYHYWLEDVSTTGATTMHGPASVTVGVPTAVTLGDFDAGRAVPALPLLAGLGLAGVAGAALWRRARSG